MNDPLALADAHALTAAEAVERLEVDADRGLSDSEADRRRQQVGPNQLGSDSGVVWWKHLVDQLADAVVVLLVGAGVAGFLIGEVIEAVAILVVLVVNTIVGFVTEFRAAQSMEALRKLISAEAEVERGDRRAEVDATELVPGDIVGIEQGERVPADIRLLEAEGLRVEEAALTGESEPVEKQVEPVAEDAPLGDRTNMVYSGTTVLKGRGRGVVVATGRATEMGKVADLAESAEQSKAPLQEGLATLSRQLAVAVIVGAALLVGVGLLRGRDVAEVTEIAVALAIAVVPEGLPAVATLTLAVGMRRMAEGHALVRRLPAVETLGSTTVVCSDKTGTLTRNQMTVSRTVTVNGWSEGDLWTTAVLCNDGDVDTDGDPVGDPTEVALLEAASDFGLEWRSMRETQAREREVPFDSKTKRMAVVVDGTVHIKGAPEALIDAEQHPELVATAEEISSAGMRTLAFARGTDASGTDEELFDDLEVIGIVGMADPPRDAAVATIAALHSAGIRTVMITGDRPDTAEAIAAEMDISLQPAVTGRQLAAMDEDELAETGEDVDVFARVDPGHKLQIVQALQQAGEVVAVTGDGVNDAPALSQADVGVAMGSGTDVAKQASDIILLDDEFSTIELAVQEGRRIFENIRRFAQFLFSWHVAEVAVISLAVVAGFPAPLGGLMILWNNLVIDVLPSFALALEPSREDVMTRPPRDPSEPVITRAIIRRILSQATLVAGVGLAAYAIGDVVFDLDTVGARTMTFVAMSAGQTLAIFNARTDHGSGFRGASRNRWLWSALGVTFVLEAVALGFDPLTEVLGLGSIPTAGWAVAGALGLVPLAATQTTRILRTSRT